MAKKAESTVEITDEEIEQMAILLANSNIGNSEVLDYGLKSSPLQWALMHRRLNGKLYAFDGPELQQQRPMLMMPLNDTSQFMCAKKGRQVGWTETMVTQALHFADVHARSCVLYTFPTMGLVSDFSNTRLAPAILDSPRLNKVTGASKVVRRGKKKEIYVNNKTLKQIGDSFFFLRSMGSMRSGISFPIDYAVWDEIDMASDEVKEVFREMLSASRYGIEREMSTPTIPNRGVSKIFELSDKKKWELKCKKCGKWQFLTFPDCIGKFKDKWVYICPICHAVEPFDKREGRWVVTGPKDAMYSGYYLSQLDVPWISAEKVMQKKQTSRFEQLFYNHVLGLDYVGDNILITEMDIANCIDSSLRVDDVERIKRNGRPITGVDWGNNTYMVSGLPVRHNGKEKMLISDIMKITDKDINNHTKMIESSIRANGTILTILDSGYGKAQNLALKKLFPGTRIWAAIYRGARGITALTDSGNYATMWREKSGEVSIHRDSTLLYYFNQWRDGNVVVPGYLVNNPHWGEFVKHHTNCMLIRQVETKKRAGMMVDETVEIVGKVGEDHFAHAARYMHLGYDKLTRAVAYVA